MTLDDIPNILKSLPDSDCTPNIVYFPRCFNAPRPSAVVMGNLLYAPTNPQPINEILEARIERATKPNRKRVLKAIKTGDDSSTDWLPSEALEIGQPFSCEEAHGTMFVTRKQPDPRGGFWILTNHPDLKSFHTSQISKVLAVKKAPVPEIPVLVSIGKRITELTADDFKNNNLPTSDEAAAALLDGHIKVKQFRAITDAVSFHSDPALFLDMVRLAGA